MSSNQMTPQQLAMIQKQQNHAFMALTVNKEALAMQSNGGALKQTFAVGQPLTYTIPTANNGYLTGFWIQCLLTVNMATGSSATYALNAGAPLTLIDSVQVQYGGQQHNFRPHIWKYLTQLRGDLAQVQPRQVIAGQQDTYLAGYYNGAPFGTATGNNTWNFSLYVPMNMINPQDVKGILPIQNGDTQCQVVVNCAGGLYGPDPVLNAVTTGGTGTGQAVTITTGTIAIIAEYKDGQSYSTLNGLAPNLSGLPTVQFLRDTPLFNVTALQVYRQPIHFLKKMPWVIATLVDGQQSNKFATTANVQIVEATADSTGNRPFWRYGLNTNLDVREFYNDLSGKFGGLLGQDLDEGILPIVYGPIYQQADPSLLEGQHYLNMSIGDGWTDFHYGAQFAAVGSVSGISPRFETHCMILNDPLVGY
jgi:hypothetical protein